MARSGVPPKASRRLRDFSKPLKRMNPGNICSGEDSGDELSMAGAILDLSGALRSLDAISGKWKLRIIWHPLGGTKRFNELHRLLFGISRGTLTFELRQLQKDGVVDRTQYSTIPPTVEYKLTVVGRKLGPILAALDEWSKFLATPDKTSFKS
jgi:DNA-binding HxlR family transcriptional regulator